MSEASKRPRSKYLTPGTRLRTKPHVWPQGDVTLVERVGRWAGPGWFINEEWYLTDEMVDKDYDLNPDPEPVPAVDVDNWPITIVPNLKYCCGKCSGFIWALIGSVVTTTLAEQRVAIEAHAPVCPANREASNGE